MNSSVRAPIALLLHSGLTASAKLIWMVARMNGHLGPINPRLLASWSGFSLPTVVRGLAHLEAVGWYQAGPKAKAVNCANADASFTFPGDLLNFPGVGSQAKLLYGLLQSTPEFQNRSGQFTYIYLRDLTRLSLPTLRRAVKALSAMGWLEVKQAN